MGVGWQGFMRVLLVLVGIFILAGAAGFALMQFGFFDSYEEKMSERCFDINRHKLKDPRSAYLESGVFTELDESKILIDVKAKNSFGAYDSVFFWCHVDDGEVREYLDID